MKYKNRPPHKFVRLLLATVFSLFTMLALRAQQFVVANKDNTRPEMDRVTGNSIAINALSATSNNGYNDISWSVFSERGVRRFMVEYSLNGVDYQTAGETLPSGTSYRIRQQINATGPVLYRVKTEQDNGQYVYSLPFFLEGGGMAPVKVYPTIVSGNTLNLNASWPVQRISIFSPDGSLVFAKDVNGQRDFIPVAIPALGKGMYWVTFFGNGWKSTEKILVP